MAKPIEQQLNIVIAHIFPCAPVKFYLLAMSDLGEKSIFARI